MFSLSVESAPLDKPRDSHRLGFAHSFEAWEGDALVIDTVRDMGYPRGTIAVAHAFRENQGDDWSNTGAYLDRLLEEARLLPEAPDTPGVVILNETLARRHWPDQDPIGKRVTLDHPRDASNAPQWLTVIGVTADLVQNMHEKNSPPVVHLPFRQEPPADVKHPVESHRQTGIE